MTLSPPSQLRWLQTARCLLLATVAVAVAVVDLHLGGILSIALAACLAAGESRPPQKQPLAMLSSFFLQKTTDGRDSGLGAQKKRYMYADIKAESRCQSTHHDDEICRRLPSPCPLGILGHRC